MPFALLIVGLLLVVTGARDTYADAGKLIVGDLTGPNNFTYWLLAFGALGAVGYSETLRPFARAFMVLIFLAMLLHNRGAFNQFGQAIKQGPTTGTGSVTGLKIGPLTINTTAFDKLNTAIASFSKLASLAA